MMFIISALRGQIATYMRIEVVDAPNSILDIATLDRRADGHAMLDRLEVDRRDAGLAREAVGRFLVALDDEIVHQDAVELTAPRQRRALETSRQRGRFS